MNETRVREAVALLRDKHLEWSDDFESIRVPLANLLERIAPLLTHQFDEPVEELVSSLLNEPHEVTELDALEQWIVDAANQLGYFELTARRSKTFRDALRRMFTQL